MSGLAPPFPWYGGKRRWSKLVWEKFGDPVCGEQPNEVAREAYEWAIEHQDDYRIAYCCQTDDFHVPDGWTCVVNTLPGLRLKNRNGKGDCVMFSPGCGGQNDLFGDG